LSFAVSSVEKLAYF